VLEFWPDYGSGPLWTHGAVISPSDVDVDPSLAERLIRWNAEYTEDKIPLDGPGDSRWMTEGRNLLAELRAKLPAESRSSRPSLGGPSGRRQSVPEAGPRVDLTAVLANWAPMSTQRKLREFRRVDMAAQISDSASADGRWQTVASRS
jgi:hypothetical protein